VNRPPQFEPRQSVNVAAGADKPKKSPAQIAGYLCTLGSFQEFLRVKFIDQWIPNAVPAAARKRSPRKPYTTFAPSHRARS
jgi:hypothetical protein